MLWHSIWFAPAIKATGKPFLQAFAFTRRVHANISIYVIFLELNEWKSSFEKWNSTTLNKIHTQTFSFRARWVHSMRSEASRTSGSTFVVVFFLWIFYLENFRLLKYRCAFVALNKISWHGTRWFLVRLVFLQLDRVVGVQVVSLSQAVLAQQRTGAWENYLHCFDSTSHQHMDRWARREWRRERERADNKMFKAKPTDKNREKSVSVSKHHTHTHLRFIHACLCI